MKRYSFVAGPLAGVVLATAAAGCSAGSPNRPRVATSPTQSDVPAKNLAPVDRTWAKASHQGNLAEIAAGQAARRKGTTPQVRAAGKLLIADHERLDRTLVKSVGALALPTRPSAGQRATAKKLAAEHGRAYDRTFVSVQIDAHRRTIAQTKKEMAEGHSPELRALAGTALPVLRKHLKRLQQIPSA